MTTSRQEQAAQAAADTKLANRVLALHREAFRERWPGSVEHCLRLTTERLQACLSKPEGTQLNDPTTWPADADTIMLLARAVESLYTIYREQV